jgi:hypothetical protein
LAILQRSQQFYLLQPGGRFGCEARKFAADHDEIVVARSKDDLPSLQLKYQSLARILSSPISKSCNAAGSGPNRSRISFQQLQSGLVAGLGHLAIDFDALTGIGNVFEGDAGGMRRTFVLRWCVARSMSGDS